MKVLLYYLQSPKKYAKRAMCDKSDSLSLRDVETDAEEEEEEEGVEICICGPKPCRQDLKDTDELSLDSFEEAEVVNVSLWNSIVQKSNDKKSPYSEWVKEKKAAEPVGHLQNGPVEFLEKEIFPLLLPAMKTMLMQARDWDALKIQKCRFNGIDFLAEVLWNRNPRHPTRSRGWLDVFSIPQFRLSLKLNPRPIFPKSWIWSRDEGATIIQKWVRGWLVRKRDDVQEMRLFWKAIVADTEKEAMELGMTYDGLVESRRQEELNTPCGRYRNLIASKIDNNK